tara:strand:+ start:588 stop:854 length:267 start_codon:yes stop_codon:yes gene_type:complete
VSAALFLIHDWTHGEHYEYALFWKADGKGYTTDVAMAGRYTAEDAHRRTDRIKDGTASLVPVIEAVMHSVRQLRQSDARAISRGATDV